MRLPVHSENNLILDPLFVELVHAKLAGSLVNRMHHEKVSVSSMAALCPHARLMGVPGHSTRVWRTVLLPILFPPGGNACRYTRSPPRACRASGDLYTGVWPPGAPSVFPPPSQVVPEAILGPSRDSNGLRGLAMVSPVR